MQNYMGRICAGLICRVRPLTMPISQRAVPSGAKLGGSSMRATNFESIFWEDADLAKTSLPAANFSGADLLGVNFKNANLEMYTCHKPILVLPI